MATGRKVLRGLAARLDKLVAIVFAVAGGLVSAQFPQYLAQYLQRLGGHIDEAQLSSTLFKLPVLATRADGLAAGLNAIERAPAWLRLPRFLIHAQWDIAREAYKHFAPGMTFSSEEIIYLAAGCLFGFVIYEGVKGLGRLLVLLFRKLFKRKPVAARGTGAAV